MLFCAIWEQPWENAPKFNERRNTWNSEEKPDTFKLVAEYSLQSPTSMGVIIFETDRTEDVNLFRNYFALAGVSLDIRVAIDLSTSIEVIKRLQARW
jgi:hypothetical protein